MRLVILLRVIFLLLNRIHRMYASYIALLSITL
jgi:hypothetical protein